MGQVTRSGNPQPELPGFPLKYIFHTFSSQIHPDTNAFNPCPSLTSLEGVEDPGGGLEKKRKTKGAVLNNTEETGKPLGFYTKNGSEKVLQAG